MLNEVHYEHEKKRSDITDDCQCDFSLALGCDLGFWANISAFAANIGGWLTATAEISHWFLLLWGGVTLGLPVFGVLVIAANTKSIEVNEPDWYRFTSMSFNGFRWEWSWRDLRPLNMTPYCPSCKRLALHAEDNQWCRVKLMCTRCPHVERIQERTCFEIKRDLEIEIEHAVRTERWKEYVNDTQAA